MCWQHQDRGSGINFNWDDRFGYLVISFIIVIIEGSIFIVVNLPDYNPVKIVGAESTTENQVHNNYIHE